ncbi:uncharacterized protein BX663DRAFT_516317 [Cokeromyces recurvatus]|uniref:uncharacterized protein n=1 Tax=Cokeromyces recurvatus TaxID=90255 RepID=UPI002220E7B3|nr:uncharacterized protein BX663DRAFT_516317 [Cokeromyces recurvatus]KAI7900732.1 hypothetical protein BX663DRAFT_516317 [Cokeromyces recurvatus]
MGYFDCYINQYYNNNSDTSNKVHHVNMAYAIKPLNLQGGQCTWCGKYGHKRISCPLLK